MSDAPVRKHNPLIAAHREVAKATVALNAAEKRKAKTAAAVAKKAETDTKQAAILEDAKRSLEIAKDALTQAEKVAAQQ